VDPAGSTEGMGALGAIIALLSVRAITALLPACC